MNDDTKDPPAEEQTPAPAKKQLPPRRAAPVTPPLPPVTVTRETDKTNPWHWLIALGIVGTIYLALSQPLRP